MDMGNMMRMMGAWNTFKQTGDINTFLELMEVKNIEENINLNEEDNGNNKTEWNSNIGK